MSYQDAGIKTLRARQRAELERKAAARKPARSTVPTEADVRSTALRNLYRIAMVARATRFEETTTEEEN